MALNYILSYLCDLLEPLKELTTVLSAQQYVTLSILYPAVYNLIHYSVPYQEFQSEQINTVKQELLISLKNRLNHVLENDLFLALTYKTINFNFKNFEFIKDIINRELHIDRAKEYLRYRNGNNS